MLYFPATAYIPAFKTSIKFYFYPKCENQVAPENPISTLVIKITLPYFATDSLNLFIPP